MKTIIPVILAGGSGTRLWPLSRQSYPKQFLTLDGDYSLLQTTCLRLSGLTNVAPMVITNEEYRFAVSEHLRQIGITPSAVLLEPVSRNTAAAIAAAALYSRQFADDSVLLVLPSDHDFSDAHIFFEAVGTSYDVAMNGKLITFGVTPTQPETGFGYIRCSGSSAIREVEQFVEKPSLEIAKTFVNSGDYLWNSGIFMFRSDRYLAELKKYEPTILRGCQEAVKGSSQDKDFVRLEKEAFESCPSVSIDIAVMEKTDNAVVVEITGGWRDIGSWDALWEIRPQDESNNVLSGSVLAKECKNTLVISDSRLVVTVGLENVIVVDTVDALLVADKSRTQEIKEIVADIGARGFSEATTNRKVYRPWGSYELISQGDNFVVKKLRVNPGAALSMQKHEHRSEHWVVVSGAALVTKNGVERRLTANESIYIPIGDRHRLQNIGEGYLEVIEVQSGQLLSENDIVRYDDFYGRAVSVQ